MKRKASNRGTGRSSQRVTRPDLIAVVDSLGMTDKAVEIEAGLPQGFISKARRGGGAGGKAAGSWARLEDWLAGRGLGPRASVAKEQASDAEDAKKALALAIEKARTSRALRDVAKKISLLALAGAIDRGDAGLLIDAVKEQRACHKAAREEKGSSQVRALRIMAT